MKKILTSSCLLFLHLASSAQHTELYADVNAGLLSFRGKSAVNASFIIQSDVFPKGNYTNDLYSKKSGVGIGLGMSAQRVTRSKFIYGIAASMELLKHRMPIHSVSGRAGSLAANGGVNIHSHFINIKPIAGYRFSLNKKITLDLAASLEVAIGLADLYEVGSATLAGSNDIVRVENDRDEIITDFRTGVQAKVNVKRYALLLGYWIGQSNYYNGYVGGSFEAYSKVFRMGLSYRLNKSKK